jgi:hypothetical protein
MGRHILCAQGGEQAMSDEPSRTYHNSDPMFAPIPDYETEDGLRFMRGLAIGVLCGLPFWLAAGYFLWRVFR